LHDSHRRGDIKHTLQIPLQDQLQVRINTKDLPRRPDAPAPRQLSTHTIVLLHIVLRKPGLGVVSVARVRELQLAPRAHAALDPLPLGASLALDADHLGLLDDANLGTGGEVHENADAAGEAALGVWDGGWVVGDQETELEFRVVVQDVIVLEACSRGIVVCCTESVRTTDEPNGLIIVLLGEYLTDKTKLFTKSNLLFA
jgi:hypothetical protein